MPRFERVAAAFPLKAYADYPFGVCVNDQYDRFSAPIEWRFTADEVDAILTDAGFVDVVVLDNNGWLGSGRRPAADPTVISREEKVLPTRFQFETAAEVEDP